MKELEEQALKLAQEMRTLNGALTMAQGEIISMSEEPSEANASIKDLKLKLGELKETLSEARTREGILTKELETEKQLLMNETADLKDYKAGEKRWLGRLANVANSTANQLAIMGMPEMGYSLEASLSPNANLTIYFEKVVGALKRLPSNRAASLAEESRILCRGTMTRVLTKIAHWHPDLDFEAVLKSLPEDADIAALKERIKPIISRIDGIKRLKGQHRD